MILQILQLEKFTNLMMTLKTSKVEKQGKYYIVAGKRVEDLMRRVNIGDYESLFYLHKKLDKEIGVTSQLKTGRQRWRHCKDWQL